jgi:hypothetical protein
MSGICYGIAQETPFEVISETDWVLVIRFHLIRNGGGEIH